MATYLRLSKLERNRGLFLRVQFAAVMEADRINTDSSPLFDDKVSEWATKILSNPKENTAPLFWALLADRSNATIPQIEELTDAEIQTSIAKYFRMIGLNHEFISV